MSRRKATVAIGGLLKRAREAAGQTQEQRASQVNVALRSLKVAEGGGEVDQQVLCRLIRACGIGPESKLAVDKDFLKQARVSAGLTRSDLAQRTELSEVQVRSIETGGQPLTVRVAARMAGAGIAPPPLTCLEFGGVKASDDTLESTPTIAQLLRLCAGTNAAIPARGFAVQTPERRQEIARAGGIASAKGNGHKFSSEEARIAGKLGGTAISGDRAHMSRIGRLGGRARKPRQA